MTIPNTDRKDTYTGNGTTADYDFGFKIFAAEDLVVKATDSEGRVLDLELDTDFTVPDEDVGNVDGGTISLVNDGQEWLDGSGFLDSGWTLTIERTIAIKQTLNLSTNSALTGPALEIALDKRCAVELQQQAQIDGTIRLDSSEDADDFDLTLPTVEERRNKAFVWDDDGNPTTAVLTSVGADAAATFITVSNESGLANERRLIGTANQIAVTDNGAGSTVALSIPTNPTLPGNVTTGGSLTTTTTLTAGTGATVTTGDLTVSAGSVGITKSHATTTPQIIVTQSSTGDAGMRTVAGSRSWMWGIDHSEQGGGGVYKLAWASSTTATVGTDDVIVVGINGGLFMGSGWTAGLGNLPLGTPLNLRYGPAAASGKRHLALEHVNISDSSNILGSYFDECCVITTDATVTTLGAYGALGAIPSAYVLEATVAGYRYGGASGSADDSAGYKLYAIFKNSSGGTLTQVGSTTKTVLGEDQAAWDATIDASGTNMRVRVTGAANNNIRWVAHVTVTMTTIRVDS